MDSRPANKYPFYIKLACMLFSLVAIGYIVTLAKEILSPLVFSGIFSVVLLPLAHFFEKKLKFPRSAAALLSVIIMLTSIGLLLYVLSSQFSMLMDDWPQFIKQLGISLDIFQNWIDSTFQVNAVRQLTYLRSAAIKFLDSGTTVVTETLLSISSLLLFFVFTFLYTFFFLFYRRLIMTFVHAVFKEKNAWIVTDVTEQIQLIIRKYIIGLLIEMAIVSSVLCFVFWFLDIKYALLLGLLTGLLNIIPYVGILTALVLSTLITFATTTVYSKVLFVAITLVSTHLADSNVLMPMVVGSKVKINAFVTILGVVIGEHLWGLSGMFLSIPLIAVFKIIFDRVESLKPWGIVLGEEEQKRSNLFHKWNKTLGKIKIVR